MIKIFRLIMMLQLCWSSLVYASSIDTYPFTSTTDVERFNSLTKEIRCVVCQNQSIADSSAPLAKDLRSKIYNMIVEKKSDTEISDFLVKRYGQFILLKPKINNLTLFLWMFPFLGLIVAFLFLIRVTKNQYKTQNSKTRK